MLTGRWSVCGCVGLSSLGREGLSSVRGYINFLQPFFVSKRAFGTVDTSIGGAGHGSGELVGCPGAK